ncbi:hypothetical protein LBMAG41_12250 [Cyanobium sp.]|jgi:hypothetical protein|nr:hypothetical protein LBMAG41_12250 [Cyanobium sp.]
MIFKPKFFLDLTNGKDELPAAPAVVAPVREKAAPAKGQDSKTAEVAVRVAPIAQSPRASEPAKVAAEANFAAEAAEAFVAAVAPVAAAAAAASTSLTTAESIAAELAAAQANRPAPSLATFAPEALVPGGATPRRRRSGGANLAGFKAIARSFVKN